MKHTSSTICEMTDPEGNLFKVKYVEINKFMCFKFYLIILSYQQLSKSVCSLVALKVAYLARRRSS